VVAAGQFARRLGQPAAAARLFEQAAEADSATEPGESMRSLSQVGRAHLAAGQRRQALAATLRGTDLRRVAGLAQLKGDNRVALWWAHHRALRADGRRGEAAEALAQACAFLLEAARGLSDEGLRRSQPCKIAKHREVVRARLKRARKLPRSQREAHLAGESRLREPFERLVENGLRLNELWTEAELREFLVDEVTELSGAERVLLVLDTAEGTEVVGSLLPQGECEAGLLAALTPWLAKARRTRAARLRHGPEGAEALGQRSCLVVPLMAQRELLGYVYADIEARSGASMTATRSCRPCWPRRPR
jgi:hypothetical protein